MKIGRIIGTNAVIEENRAALGGITYPKLALYTLLVYLLGNFIASAIIIVPTMIFYLNSPEFNEFVASGITDYREAAEAIASIKLPDWLGAVTLFATVGTVVSALIVGLKIEKRRPFGMGLVKSGAALEYLIGLAVGTVLFAAAFGIGLISGEYRVGGLSGDSLLPWLPIYFVGFMVQGASEELLMRAFFTVSASRARGGVPVAVLLNGLLFAALHLGNPGMNVLSFVNLFLFGVFAAIYFIRRGSIWGIAAVHTAWNFVQGNVFGALVSGGSYGPSVLTAEYASGTLFSGGSFGPEGGLGVTIALVIGIALITLMKNKKVVPPEYTVSGQSAGFSFDSGDDR